MKLLFLGSGSAFVPMTENYQSNMILESGSGKRLLIDCGTDARHSMKAVNLSYQDVDGVYISHFHADHVGGLEWLAFNRKFDQSVNLPKLFIHPTMLLTLWEKVLRGGLESLEETKASIDTYFNIQTLRDEKHFTWESIEFELVKTTHIYNGEELVQSYGLFISDKKYKVFITTDTRFIPNEFMDYYLKADIIFHDCELGDATGVHSHFSELITLSPKIKSKMWLYHYSGDQLPDAKAEGFRGFVKRGQEFIF